MTSAQEKARADLPGWVSYFRIVAQDSKHYLRETEYEVAAATVDLIFTKNYFAATDFDAIASSANSIVGREHSNGSGWLAFQHEISRFFYSFGYNSDWNSITGEFSFWKRKSRFWKGLIRILNSFALGNPRHSLADDKYGQAFWKKVSDENNELQPKAARATGDRATEVGGKN